MAIHIPDNLAAFTTGPDWTRFDDPEEVSFCREAGPIFITIAANANGLFDASALDFILSKAFGIDPVDISGLPGLLAEVQDVITKATAGAAP